MIAVLSLLLIAIYAIPALSQSMTNQKASINRITKDFAVADLGNPGWNKAKALWVTTYWNGVNAPDGRRFDVRMLWSDSALYVRFDATQTETLVVSDKPELTKKTMQLWDRDVCELFLAPDARNRRRYAEFEIAPTGEWLDLMLDWMKDEPRNWNYASGMESAAKIEPDKVTMAMKIPWTAFGVKPKAGDVWLGNLFRQVGSGETRGYLAWSPTMTKTPNFHVPERFGEFVFRD